MFFTGGFGFGVPPSQPGPTPYPPTQQYPPPPSAGYPAAAPYPTAPKQAPGGYQVREGEEGGGGGGEGRRRRRSRGWKGEVGYVEQESGGRGWGWKVG